MHLADAIAADLHQRAAKGLSPASITPITNSITVTMLRGDADIRHVQALLGHASIETTKIYLRMVPGHLRDEYDKAMPTIAMGMP